MSLWRGDVIDGEQAPGIVGALLPCEIKMGSSAFVRGGFVSKSSSEVIAIDVRSSRRDPNVDDQV